MEEKLLELFSYFVIYSFFGWLLESVYKTVLQKKLVNSGFLYGPFCPIYGVGAILMLLCLEEFKGSPFLIFCLGFVVLSVWEYIVGVLLEKVFQTRYWDYSNYKYNLQGRVCLQNSIIWGLLGLVFINWIHPFIQSKLLLINVDIIRYINLILFVYFIADMILSSMAVNRMNLKLSKLSELNQGLKDKLEEIKELGKNVTAERLPKIDVIQSTIDELNEKKDELKKRLNKRINHLKKAFPGIQSDKLTEFFNMKIEVIKKEKKDDKNT